MIEKLKDLEALMKLCRKQGVKSITLEGITFELADIKQTKASGKEVKLPNFDPGIIPRPMLRPLTADKIETDEPSEMDLLFYSATGQSEVL